ncbi:hypothetical protein AOQ71_10275 [Bradyrhizobium manausense]|uniref:Uncharacterized protein n=1 Tax=Bradyrhizobium manausense TaxID=989370 RepID=A0A0R3DZJ5_9BRAD|nr:hypothetical protein AOQ71_10275 [Bradyrhizobium manausense]
MGDIASESTGDFTSVRLGDFVGIRRQKHRSALEIAERILWLASQGEREAATIKEHLLNEFLASGSCSVRAEKAISIASTAPRLSSHISCRGY